MMVDKNGVEIRTGCIVEITRAFFKSDNGLYFVQHSPGDPSWRGQDYSLKKISKTGKISKAKYNLGFWPVYSCVSDRYKTAEANQWNKVNAQIEVKEIKNMAEVAAYFQAEADSLNDRIRWTSWNFGETHPEVEQLKALQAHYEAVAKSVMI